MGEIRVKSPLVHPFAAVMFPNDKLYRKSLVALQKKFGEILGKSEIFPVTKFTNYYVREFGKNLKKQFFLFKHPIPVEGLYQSKIWSNQLEVTIAEPENEQRFVNIDPGYLAPAKFVLFSSKDFSHRIYINDGIFAEITMLYMHGQFHKMGWTYKDYWENRSFFLAMRQKILSLARNR